MCFQHFCLIHLFPFAFNHEAYVKASKNTPLQIKAMEIIRAGLSS